MTSPAMKFQLTSGISKLNCLSTAGSSVYALDQAAHTLSPGAGLAVFAGWVALALAGAAYRLVRTDA